MTQHDPEHDPEGTRSDDAYVTVTRRYRRPPGGWLWGALIGVPLLLALPSACDGPATQETAAPTTSTSPSTTAPTPTSSSATPTSTSPSPTPSVTTVTVTPTPSVTTVTVTATPRAEAGASGAAAAPKAAIACGTFTRDVSAILKSTPIQFVQGGTQLTPASKTTVGSIAGALKGCGTKAAVVTGYTDNTGSPAMNDKVSAARAAAVRNELVAQGVPADRVASAGAGSANPVASNTTAQGRAANRRVEIVAN